MCSDVKSHCILRLFITFLCWKIMTTWLFPFNVTRQPDESKLENKTGDAKGGSQLQIFFIDFKQC